MSGLLQKEIRQTKPFRSKEQEAFLSLLKTADLMRRIVSGVLEPHSVTPQQYNVLRILRGAGDKPLPTLAIRGRMVEQTPGITRLLDRLEAKGWVERKRCTEDRRQVLCRITPQGRDLLSRLDAPMRGVDKTALSGLEGGRIDQLIELLDAVRAAHRQPDELQAKEIEEEEQS